MIDTATFWTLTVLLGIGILAFAMKEFFSSDPVATGMIFDVARMLGS